MTKTAAILVLALPALMMAGVNRLNPNPDLVADDTRTWCLRRAERPQLATSFGPPQGAVAFAFSSPQLGLTSTPCQASCPTRAEVCHSQPDLRSACSGSSGWLFALTVAEENTATAKTEPNPAPTAARKNLPAK
jgi:hypothetical protein